VTASAGDFGEMWSPWQTKQVLCDSKGSAAAATAGVTSVLQQRLWMRHRQAQHGADSDLVHDKTSEHGMLWRRARGVQD
jgi:hypothetical protein